VPFGFVETEGRLVKVEQEAQVVAEIIRHREKGGTLTEIAEQLNTRGIAGKQGGRWYASTVRNILQRHGEVRLAA